jgi:hypothetical protein
MKQITLIGFLSVLFGFRLFAQPVNDNFAAATDVTAIINAGCTSGGVYTTVAGTADQAKGSCWTNGPNKNVWFKFTATATSFINVQVKVSGAGETMRYPFVALWDGTPAQLACTNNQGAAVDISMSYHGLTPGNTYYISIDNHSGGTYGKFDICLSDVVDYDYPEGATDLTASINGGCSTGGTYSTLFGSADHAKGSCWTNGPNRNRWFKFTATATTFINVQVKVAGGQTMRYPFVALWDASYTQIACTNNQGAAVDISMSYYGLTPGNVYYISVDTHSGGTYGTFDICLSDVVDYDYPEGAVDLTASVNGGCSTGGTYSTLFGSADHAKGSCWTNGPNRNRWFKFTASASTFINVQVKVAGGQTMRYPFVALWDASYTQIACTNNQGAAVDISMSYYGLTPGNVYYISVDTHSGGTYGTFDICLSDVVDYDYPEGAVDLTASINGGCSTGGTYSTLFGSADHAKGSCWTNGPNRNRWFKFTATATTFINVQVKVAGGQTMRYPFVALWDASYTQVACTNNQGAAVDISMSYYGLTPGNVYYISVDTHSGGTYGTFDICLSDVVDYDYPDGAVDLNSLMNGCTSGGTYSTLFASSDHAKGSCWTNGPNRNRWFKFTATATTFINVQVIVASGQTMRYPFVALWDASYTQIACTNNQGAAVDISMSYYGLTPGNVYYISVDNHSGGTYGTFDICVSDIPDYDYPEGAVLLTNLNNYCSTGGTYSTIGGSADHAKGSCWTNGPNRNRWFKFVAISNTVTIQVKVASGQTMRYPFVALWDASYSQLGCTNNAGAAVDISLVYSSLTVGNTYYFSVDNHSGGTYGTFDICINNASSVQYYSIGNGDWSNSAVWSTTGFGGATAGTTPSAQHIVNIQDYTISVTSAQSCAEINMTVSAANTNLTIDNAALTVNGKFNATNGANFGLSAKLNNAATFTVNDDATFTRNGGTGGIQMDINNTSLFSVGKDMLWNSTAGTGSNNLITVNNSADIVVGRDVTQNYSGGQKIGFTFNNSSSFSVGRDFTFTSNAAAKTEAIFNSTSSMSIKRNIVRGATPYGMLTFNNSSSLALNGNANAQILPASAGSGGDAITYKNVTLNNSSGYFPTITMGGAATINGTLTLSDGVVQTTAANIIAMAAGATTSLGSSSSYVNGPVSYAVAASGISTLNFPVGKSTIWGPVSLTVDHSSATSYTYTSEMYNASASALGWTLAPTIDKVSSVRYWDITRSSTLNLNSATVTLTYDATIGVTDYTNLTVVKNTAASPTAWTDINGTATGNTSGSITSGPFTSFSRFTFGNKNGGMNPLPVELLSFDANQIDKAVEISWVTASEKNCDHFIVERSREGNAFEAVAKVTGAGNSSVELSYSTTDYEPYNGISYYRLKQVDFNGTVYYSSMIPVTFSGDLGVFSVYPTLSSGTFTVSYSGNTGQEVLLVIRNILGQEYYSKGFIIENGSFVQAINLTDKLSPGVYMIVASSDDRIHEKKIIIK